MLALLVLAVYWQVGGHPFHSVDDAQYVFENPRVAKGLTWTGISWAFTSFHASNWHPLTWLSHMADVGMFGLDAGWHHRVNLLFHLANTVLLFLALQGMTGSMSKSLFAAALFAVHPLHVESVAWISERKDLLGAFFFILAMGAYLGYVRKPNAARYLPVAGCFALGLMAKPMVVTLPFALLLLDYWPLGRIRLPDRATAGREGSGRSPVLRPIAEKVPLLALSALSCVLTLLAQSGKAVAPLERYPLSGRLANALASYVDYLVKTVWPSHLSAFYPYPRALPYLPGSPGSFLQGAAAAAVLAAITFLALRAARRQPYLATGWLWYLGTLVPAIGLVQVGRQSMADRYTYLPLVGIFVMAAWWASAAFPQARARRKALVVLACAAVLASSAAAWNRTGYWKSGVKLFTQALETEGNNWFAWKCLAVSHAREGRFDQAVRAYEEELRLVPGNAEGWLDLGVALSYDRHFPAAVEAFRRAAALNPAYPEAWYNLGIALGNKGDVPGSAEAFREAIRRRPGYVEAWNNLGIACAREGRYPAAIEAFRTALGTDPDNGDAWFNLGSVSLLLGDREQAMESFRQLLRVDPGKAERLKGRIGPAR